MHNMYVQLNNYLFLLFMNINIEKTYLNGLMKIDYPGLMSNQFFDNTKTDILNIDNKQ